MEAEKKCGNCGEWTIWTQDLTDKCVHCGSFLQEKELVRIEEIQRKEKEYQDNIFYQPRDGDGPLMLVIRKAAFVLHLIFAAITWAVMWFTVTFSG